MALGLRLEISAPLFGAQELERPRAAHARISVKPEPQETPYEGLSHPCIFARRRVVGVLQITDWAMIIPPDKAGLAFTIVGVVSAALRFFTSTPVFDAK